jgi:hypothetical protein
MPFVCVCVVQSRVPGASPGIRTIQTPSIVNSLDMSMDGALVVTGHQVGAMVPAFLPVCVRVHVRGYSRGDDDWLEPSSMLAETMPSTP